MGVVDWGPLLQELSHINDSAQNLPGIFQKLADLINSWQHPPSSPGGWGGSIGSWFQSDATALGVLEYLGLVDQHFG